MFEIVNDVEAYPRRFNWCVAAQVEPIDASTLKARLTLRFAGMNLSFTTRNRVVPDSRIELALVEGPFTDLSGAWQFRPLGEEGCKVSLDLDFEMAGKWVGSAMALGFQSLADKLVDDFVRAALAT